MICNLLSDMNVFFYIILNKLFKLDDDDDDFNDDDDNVVLFMTMVELSHQAIFILVV